MKKQDELRELDAKVAERVMGVDLNPDLYRIEDNNMLTIPAYGSDIKAAWLVVEKLRELDFWVMMGDHDVNDEGTIEEIWWCKFYPGEEGIPDSIGEAPTAPEAICLAALASVEAVELIKEYEKGE